MKSSKFDALVSSSVTGCEGASVGAYEGVAAIAAAVVGVMVGSLIVGGAF